MTALYTVAIRCSYQGGCARTTTDPSGLCWQHIDATALAGTTPQPALAPVPTTNVKPSQVKPAVDRQPITPRPYQVEAVDAVEEELKDRDRALVRAACGMGKTVMAQELIRRHFDGEPETGVYVLLTSSIKLTEQTASDFERDSIIGGLDGFQLHDGSPHLKAARQGARTPQEVQEADLQALTAFLEGPSDKPRIIFSTYDSYDKIIAAQARVGDTADADILILDECHRLGGVYNLAAKPSKKLTDEPDDDLAPYTDRLPRVLFNDGDGSLKATKRVFLSATPKTRTQADDLNSSDIRATKRVLLEALAAQQRGREPDLKIARNHLLPIYHTDTEIFGRTVYSKGLDDAMGYDALVPVHASVSPCKIKGSSSLSIYDDKVALDGTQSAAGEMKVVAWATARSTLEHLATQDSHNVLVFSHRISDANDISTHWGALAREMAGGASAPTPVEARRILETGQGDVRAARLVLLGQHGSVLAASSRSTEAVKEAAMSHFDTKTVGDSGCNCGRPGGWCACARVVSNVDLFGEGISINSVDAVVVGSRNKTTDTQFTQAIGRAARKWESGGKQRGSVVIPAIEVEDSTGRLRRHAELTGPLLYALDRVRRDVIRTPLGDRSAIDLTRSTDVQRVRMAELDGIREEMRRTFPEPVQALVLDTAWGRIEADTKVEFKDTNPGVNWGSLSKQDQHDRVMRHASVSSSPESYTLMTMMPTTSDVSAAASTLALVERQVTDYDRESVTNIQVAKALGYIDKNGMPSSHRGLQKRSIETLNRLLGGRIIGAVVKPL